MEVGQSRHPRQAARGGLRGHPDPLGRLPLRPGRSGAAGSEVRRKGGDLACIPAHTHARQTANSHPAGWHPPQSAPSPNAWRTLDFSRKWLKGRGRGEGAEARSRGQVQENEGRAPLPSRPPHQRSPPLHPSWRRASGASGRSFMEKCPPRRQGLL